jgi:hypothetical protein
VAPRVAACTHAVRTAAALAALALGLAAALAGAADEAPAGWRLVYDYLVQDVCLGPADAPLIGVSPADGPARCPRHRDLRVGERLPYHKHDWASHDARAALPEGYQRSDDFPIRTRRLGVAVLQSFDFGSPPARFDRFDPSDGGQLALFSPNAVAYGLTEDGGGGLQLFLGPACASPDPVARLQASWIVVDRSFAAGRPGHALARLTTSPERCPAALANAFTRWRVRGLALRIGTGGAVWRHNFSALISDHFGGRNPQVANHLERFYFTRELGLVRWERWENLARPGDPAARTTGVANAEPLAASDRCEAIAEPPAATGRWLMTDCRQWTNIVAPRDPAGDPPGFWLDRLRAAPATAALFAE